MTDPAEPTALIVGASRGLGLGLVHRHLERGWRVIATVRGEVPALDAIARDDRRLRIERLDVNREEQIEALADRLAGTTLDLLFVNAGISHDPSQTAAAMTEPAFLDIIRGNTLGPIRVVERLGGLVPEGGTIAVMSSGLGSVAGNETGGYEAYRASKAALNTMLRSVAARDTKGRCFLAVAPGWVRTDMGGDAAPLDVETSTAGILDTLEARRGQAGARFVSYQNREVAW